MNIREFKITLKPIGWVESPIKSSSKPAPEDKDKFEKWKEKVKEEERKIKKTISKLVLLPEYEEMLDGLEEFSHILVTYWPHRLKAEKIPKKIHPMGIKHLPLKGIFATCSPMRPNSLLISVVELVEIEGAVVKVKGLEAFDGSPILDIKPYTPYYHHVEEFSIPKWLEYIDKEFS